MKLSKKGRKLLEKVREENILGCNELQSGSSLVASNECTEGKFGPEGEVVYHL